MKTEKLFGLILMGVLSLASLVVPSGREVQASPMSSISCTPDGSQCYNTRSFTAPYPNFRDQMPKSGPRFAPTPEVYWRMVASTALSWALLFGGLLVLAGSVRAWLAPERRRYSRRRHVRWVLASPATALALSFFLVLAASVETMLPSSGKSVLAAVPMLVNSQEPTRTQGRLRISDPVLHPMLHMERMPDVAGRVPSWKMSRTSVDRSLNDRSPRPAAPATSLAPDSVAPEFHSPAGNFQSALQIGGTGTTQIGGTAFDGFGNLFVTGGFVGTIVFNTIPPTTLVATADYDFFITKFDPAGGCLWARMAQGATGLPAGLSVDGGLTVAVDNQGSCYVGGGFVKRLLFKDANNNTVATLTDSGSQLSYEMFVGKYDSNGVLLWVRGGQSGSPQHPTDLRVGVNGITDLALDGAGNPYVVGAFSGNNFLGTPVSVKGRTDALVARLHPLTGAPVWVSLIGSVTRDTAVGLGIDNASNVHVVGSIGGEATFPTVPPQTGGDPDNRSTDTFFAEYNQNGICILAGTIVAEDGGSVFGTDIAVTGAGQEYIVGQQYAANFDEVGFLTKFEPHATESSLDDFFPGGHADKVTLDGAGNPYVTGTLFGTAQFGFDDNLHVLTSLGGGDQFITKYRQNPDALGRGVVEWARALPGSGAESTSLIPGVTVAVTRLAFNSLTGAMHVSGDFNGTLTLDNLTLHTSGANRHGFVAAFGAATTPAPPVITTSSPFPNGTVGAAYSQSLAATAGTPPYNWSITAGSLPGGLTLSTAGVVSGTPTTAGSFNLTVQVSDGAALTATQAFAITISNPAPTLASLNPDSAIAGGAAFTLTVNGTNFVASSKVRWNGADRETTVVSSTQLRAALLATDIAAAGSASVTVFSPAPGGGASTALSFTISPPPPARAVRVVETSALLGGTAKVAILIDARGDEMGLQFSLTYDPALLSNPQVELGSEAKDFSFFETNQTQTAQGRLGVLLLLKNALAAGTRQVVVVSFQVASATNAASAQIGFGDAPILRFITDANASQLAATYTPGTITFASGFEADADGDNLVTVADAVKIILFAAGKPSLSAGSLFQRADCAPQETKGDGVINLADVVQAMRYASGKDGGLVPAGGPTGQASAATLAARSAVTISYPEPAAVGGRTLRATDSIFQGGQINSLNVELTAQGDEVALGFSLNFDPHLLRFSEANVSPMIVVGSANVSPMIADRTLLMVNDEQAAAGRVGLLLMLPPGERFAAGSQAAVTLRFMALADGPSAITRVSFGDDPVARQVADESARLVAASYSDAVVTIVSGPWRASRRDLGFTASPLAPLPPSNGAVLRMCQCRETMMAMARLILPSGGPPLLDRPDAHWHGASLDSGLYRAPDREQHGSGHSVGG